MDKNLFQQETAQFSGRSTDQELQPESELSELQLALVGGGIGDTILV